MSEEKEPQAYYRIRDWTKWFENNRTRELKTAWWTPIPNWIDTDAYMDIMSHPDGPAIYGVWLACVQTAAKVRCCGTLVRNTRAPHTFDTLSRLFRMPAETVKIALEILENVTWIERITLTESEVSNILRTYCETPAGEVRESRPRGEERRGENINTPYIPRKRGTSPGNSNGNHKPTRKETRDQKALEHMKLLEGVE